MFFFKYFLNPKKIEASKFSWRMLIWIFVIFTLHVYLISAFEKMSLMDSFWYTATAAMTVGFGDIAPKTTEGRFTTMILIYVGLIFIIAKTANDWFELGANRIERKLKGTWSYHMKNHIVIIGHPSKKPELFLENLSIQLNSDTRYKNKEFVLVSSDLEELPQSLKDRGFKWVHGSLNQIKILEKANVMEAEAIYIVAPDSTNTDFDSFALDIIDMLREQNCKAYIISEVVNPANDRRLKKVGADSVLRVTHGYPNIAARALTVKGSEEIIQNIFSDDNEECVRVDLEAPMTCNWTDLVVKCLTKNIGTPIACVDRNGKIHTSPIGKTIEVSSIYVISSNQDKENTHRISLS